MLQSRERKLPTNSQVVKYNTAGDGNCFFHAVFGDNSSGPYKAERAQDMRMEWHKFLSQFTSLDDVSMPAPLRAQLEKVFNMFLNKPGDLTGKSDKIKELVEQTNRKIENAEDNVKRLVSKAVSKFNISRDQAMRDLGEYAEALHGLGKNEYNAQYNSEFITHSFLNNSELYQAYLEAIKSQSYFVFIEEISMLASLANIEINVYYKDNNSEEQKRFEPDPQMINNDDQLNQVFNRESYKLNDELWGSKERETIHLGGNHYSRAKIVTKEIQEQEDFLLAKKLQLDEILEYCNLSKDISERAEVEKGFDKLLAENADGKIRDVVDQCVSDIKQRIERSEEQNPSSLLRCGTQETMVEQPFHPQQILVK
ncbi:OTU domain-containing protein [Wolbachia endosymbiont (group A) of Anomoia purmunda]|uniref:hypothetical protein n=1 Tax=Wolbachia endosymbiont (group A) of Anomoia purmunda TaxID=2953978 RepID=UPI002231AE11|nr:hypothetical protein [Wolbachia endosymbiont (group A) of Anomoia purmunda]